MSKVIFLTGPTGFIGTQIARRLTAGSDTRIVALVRATSADEALRRLRRAWWDWPELEAAIGSQVEAVAGDVRAPDLGLAAADYADLTRRVTHVVHTAADLRLDGPLAELCRVNVTGTAHVLALARAAHRDHGLKRFAHLSTAYVCGRRNGPIAEESLSARAGFWNAYEQSKYEGEALVDAAKDELPVSIFRPGMVVGDSRTGAIKTFNTVYYPLRLYLTGKLWAVPGRPDARLNLIPVDYVSDAVARLLDEPRAVGLTFHLTAPTNTLPTTGELADLVRDWAKEQLGITLPRLRWLPLPGFASRSLARLATAASPRAVGHLGPLLSLLPYLNEDRQYYRANADRLLGAYEPHWSEILPVLVAYAVAHNFLHRSERTVHEQILARLAETRHPVTYADIVTGQRHLRPAADVRADSLAAAGALGQLGIGPGDRVAIVGLNGTRYLSLDVAIGLIGAVSVPLYSTSPPSEIAALLQASEARLLLIGEPRLLARLGELATNVPIVSFCRDPLPATPPGSIQSWEDFLARGKGQPVPLTAPVGFADPATIRYTSGTTGPPKGVLFRHAELRWLAETVASLLPWQARTRPARYLSFLPLNHVVEGILATYAPYDLPVPLEIAFLENFRDLPRALPLVRPTILFSVPRLYEKVWEAFAASRPGRWYTRSSGLLRRVLRPVVRQLLLRRAGLDRCAQLIVGSAAISADLLRSYRELGIEVHDAYGLTEAPLVTLNRSGANRIGTVGEPLPETEVRIAADGEILVRGPQVMAGYGDPADRSPFRAGWLCTGDVGRLTPEGSLVIEGRKKEIIATAYGKKVQLAKVEGLLRKIPGVAEAMLIGEDRPYCAALLWVADGQCDPAALDAGVIAVNRCLSHPEQVKRWAILPNDLSVEGGGLTPNLKLKRAAIAQRLKDVVDQLYEGGVGSRGLDRRSENDTSSDLRRSWTGGVEALAGPSCADGPAKASTPPVQHRPNQAGVLHWGEAPPTDRDEAETAVVDSERGRLLTPSPVVRLDAEVPTGDGVRRRPRSESTAGDLPTLRSPKA
jgi:long-chain acyl-CoA synthetase